MDELFRTLPADTDSREALAARGLRYEVVGTDPDERDAFSQAVNRGFYSAIAEAEELYEAREGFADRRTTAVWDATAVEPETPVATVDSWPTPLTVPGGGSLPAWAISAVTVAPTHRRRGIARALLEGELRTARALRLPIAALTVSEATIYGRFGFAPAASAVDLVIDTRRAVWTGPQAAGRVHFVQRDALRPLAPGIEQRARVAGDVDRWPGYWDRLLGLRASQAKKAADVRAVRYDDEHGEPQGFALYRVKEAGHDFSRHTIEVVDLVAATTDAYAGLWRYLLELDLVHEIAVGLRSVDEPLRWMVADPRAVRTRAQSDHLWTRILDVAVALEGRTWQTAGEIVLEVSDPLGFAAGRFRLAVDEAGRATVTTTDAPAEVALDAGALAAVHLGGTSPLTLAAAGRASGAPEALERLHALAVTPLAPRLSFWF
ncbi:GNAT family N-acetyltransferase [Microcella flavibacter]|uniref:GNAT family N-acetyltransferase n=1 Tax=Microcella flavibacter TaxID=1804990 RepID=UPI001456D8BF|nr:GNAT family N-acetyltransferase [Microcella flavibacter]